jgi:hypothetical protein
MNKKLKHFSNAELSQELTQRYHSQLITRQQLLQLAEIDYCLECKSNSDQIEENGYCQTCNQGMTKITN